MMLMKRWMAMTILAAALGACGAPGTPVHSPAQSEALARFPALRFAPAEPSYALVGARTSELVSGVRELVAAFGLLAGFDMARGEQVTRRELGFNPWSLDEWAGAGIAMDRSGIAFSTGFLPTLVLPVADPDRLRAFLDRRRPGSRVSVRRYREHDWFSYRVNQGAAFDMHWIAWDDFLAVRFSLGEEDRPAAWLDALFAGAGPGERFLDALGRASAHLPEGAAGAIRGVLDARRVEEAVIALLPEDRQASLASCLRVFEPLDGVFRVAADIDLTSAAGSVSVDLTPAAADALREHLVPQPPGYPALRADAQVYAGLTVDLGWLDEQRAALGCPLLRHPLRLPGGVDARLYGTFTGAFATLLDIDMRARVLRAVAGVGVRRPEAATKLLDRIPQRRLFERDERIGDTAVKVIALPGLPRVVYRHDDRGLLVALGKGVMERVLDPGTAGGADAGQAAEVLSLGIRPTRIRDLEDILVAVARSLGYSADFARASYARLMRYDYGAVELSLEGRTLVLRLTMRLAR